MSEKRLRTFDCRLCGETYQHKARSQSRSACSVCGERQNWSNAAPEPNWWPRWIPTADNRTDQKKRGRWTNWVIAVAPLLVLNLFWIIPVSVTAILNPNSSDGPYKPRYERDIPDVVGMNLQAAQDCLQDWGFYNLDDQSADRSQGRFQINDRNWIVQRQTKVGSTTRSTDEIVLYVLRATKNNSGTTYCPKVNR